MQRITKIGLGFGLLLIGGVALAAESEFQDKMQEDLDSYKKQTIENCGTSDKLTLKWNGKLGSNPREIAPGNYTSVGTLCTSGIDALNNACQNNKVVHKAMTKLTSVQCQAGKGALSYTFKGSTITFLVDPKFDKNNAAGQESDLLEKLKNDLDK